MSARHLVVALHDVAPSTIDETRRWRELVGAIVSGPVSLLLVPRYRGHDSWRSGAAAGWVRARCEEGDEPVLHGYCHLDRRGRDGRELAGREPRAVAELVRDGAAELAAGGLPTAGWIAPSYVHPRHADGACRAAGLRWWATRLALRDAVGARPLPSLGLGASSAVRRVVSPSAARAAARALAAAPAVRLDLHPADLAHPRLERAGLALLELLAVDQSRRTLTHAALAGPWPPST